MLELLNLPIKCAFFTVTARPVNWNLASKKKETFTALDVVQMHSRHMIWIFVLIAPCIYLTTIGKLLIRLSSVFCAAEYYKTSQSLYGIIMAYVPGC
jgi:hypothetical protein